MFRPRALGPSLKPRLSGRATLHGSGAGARALVVVFLTGDDARRRVCASIFSRLRPVRAACHLPIITYITCMRSTSSCDRLCDCFASSVFFCVCSCWSCGSFPPHTLTHTLEHAETSPPLCPVPPSSLLQAMSTTTPPIPMPNQRAVFFSRAVPFCIVADPCLARVRRPSRTAGKPWRIGSPNPVRATPTSAWRPRSCPASLWHRHLTCTVPAQSPAWVVAQTKIDRRSGAVRSNTDKTYDNGGRGVAAVAAAPSAQASRSLSARTLPC